MNLTVVDLENGITKITLSGRLDVEGALKIDSEFNAIAGEKKKVLVDLSDVTFIASLALAHSRKEDRQQLRGSGAPHARLTQLCLRPL